MRRFIGLLFVCLLLANCEFKPQETQAQDTKPPVSHASNTILIGEANGHYILRTTYVKDGIEYMVIWGDSKNSAQTWSSSTINHTREKMETELLRRHGGLE